MAEKTIILFTVGNALMVSVEPRFVGQSNETVETKRLLKYLPIRL